MLISQLSGVINNYFHERTGELHKVRVRCFRVLGLMPKQLKIGFTQIYKITSNLIQRAAMVHTGRDKSSRLTAAMGARAKGPQALPGSF